VRVKIQQTQSS